MSITKRHPRPSQPKSGAPTGQKPRSAAKKKVRRRGPIVRVLPLLILVAVFVLGFRVTVVVNDVQTLMASVDVSQPGAFAQEGAGPRVEDAADATTTPAQIAQAQSNTAETNTAPADSATTGANPAVNPEDNVDVLDSSNQNDAEFNTDPQTFTQSELELLQRLSERRKVIEAQAQENKAREAMLKAAEARIDGKIAELQQLEQTLSDLVAEADGQQKAKIDQLVRIYGAMKPKDAARIFNDLDMPILLTVVEGMKESKVAPILADMDAMKATAVTEALSMRKLIPGINDDPQG